MNCSAPWFEELGQKSGGEVAELVGVSRPDGGDLRDQQAFDEPARVAPTVEELPQRGARAVRPEQAAGLAEEAGEVGDHPVKARVGDVSGACEDAAGIGRPLEAAAAVSDRERHLGRLRRHPELIQQALEVRVVAVVEDDEPGVDVPGAPRGLDRHRVGVPAGAGVGLEHDHVVSREVELARRDQARDPGADDRDAAHRASTPLRLALARPIVEAAEPNEPVPGRPPLRLGAREFAAGGAESAAGGRAKSRSGPMEPRAPRAATRPCRRPAAGRGAAGGPAGRTAAVPRRARQCAPTRGASSRRRCPPTATARPAAPRRSPEAASRARRSAARRTPLARARDRRGARAPCTCRPRRRRPPARERRRAARARAGR